MTGCACYRIELSVHSAAKGTPASTAHLTSYSEFPSTRIGLGVPMERNENADREHTGVGAPTFPEDERADSARQRAEARYRALVGATQGTIFRINGDGTFLEHVGADGELGFRSGTWLGEGISEVMPAAFAEQTMLHAGQALKTDEVQVFKSRISNPPPDAGLRDLETRMVVSGDNEVLAIVRDVTEREQLQEQLLHSQRMEAIGRLAGGMAHDFNNLLTPIISYVELATEVLAPDSQIRGFLQEIRKAAERAAHLTRQLLSFSRSQIMEQKVIKLNDLILDMDRMFRRLIGEDIELVTLPAADLGLVKVDPGQIEQVLVNLVVNAHDAMPDGGKLIIESRNVTIDSHFNAPHGEMAPGTYATLAVSDSGQGMPPEVKECVFEPFFTTKRPDGRDRAGAVHLLRYREAERRTHYCRKRTRARQHL